MQILKKEVEENILGAALEEFRKNGYSRTTIRKIIRRACVSIGNFYNYFKNKKELFERIVRPVIVKIETLKEGLFSIENGKDFSDPGFISEFAGTAACSFLELFKDSKDEFVILMDKSEGSPFAGYKTAMIKALSMDFEEDISGQEHGEKAVMVGMKIMPVLAKNLVDSLIEIAKTDCGYEELSDMLSVYLSYHLTGFGIFYHPVGC